MWAMPMITAFNITKDENIPTHSIVEITLSDKEEAKERDYVRSLPSLRQILPKKLPNERKERRKRKFTI